MKLRKLELTNVRRFGGKTASLGPFGDGLTTITAPNEAGKSTFFDALHALFFIKHGSGAREVKSLQPYSGGAVSIAAEIEIDGKDYRIEKTFNQKKAARVIDCASKQILKQDGDAEAWIEDNINKVNKGPADLLWVRQGAADVDPQGREASNVEVRRDLMSSVRGQIDAVTGGRRMDKIVERCRKELDAMATKAMKAKAGSAWKQIEDKIEALEEEKDALAKAVSNLSEDLEIKRRAMKRLREMQTPETIALRQQRLAKATQALEDAKQHDQSIKDAQKALKLVAADKDRLIRQIKDITDARSRRKRLADDILKEKQHVADAQAAQEKQRLALDSIKTAIAQQDAKRREMVSSLKTARLQERSEEKWSRLGRISELFQQLKDPQTKQVAATKVLQRPEVTQADLDRLDELTRRISVAQEQRRALFASFSIQPQGTSTAEIDGTALAANEDVLLDRPIDLHIPGFGNVLLRPAEDAGKGIENPEALLAEREQMLRALGFDNLVQARDAFNTRQSADNDRQVAVAEIRALAPDGIEALNGEWKSLCNELGHPLDKPALPPTAQQALALSAEQLEESITNLDDKLDALRGDLERLQQVAGEAASKVAETKGLLKHLSGVQETLTKPEDEDSLFADLKTKRDKEIENEVKAQQTLDHIKQMAPDLDVAQTAYQRLLSAEEGNRAEINKLEKDLARASGAIERQSEGAVEEKLAEVVEQLAKARERAGRYELQAQALNMLIEHLETARRDAQETYFEPIRKELLPLLAQLHVGAEFTLHPDKMLVNKIIRNGVEDDVEVLSGGAYEQIAILTRLAFAKLFAKEGRHVPVILDDALVHTDDERISTMFNMLSQVARDQQIIVLSCRTRAFSDLGGTRAFIEISDAG